MEHQIDNDYTKIANKFEDTKIKSLNYFRTSTENEIDTMNISQKQNVLKYNISNDQFQNSIMNKAKDLYPNKLDIYKPIEERKNTENNNYKSIKDASSPYTNNYLNIENEKNGLNTNRLIYNENEKNNIKDILYQNKTIINNINSIINNDMNDKIKTEPNNLNYKNTGNSLYYLNTFSNNINSNDKYKDIEGFKSKEKTFYNYNEDFQKEMGGKDNYLENIEKFSNERTSELKNISNDKITNYISNISSNTNDTIKSNNLNNTSNNNISIGKYNFEKKDIVYNQTAKFNTIQKDVEKKEEYKPIITNTNINSNITNMNGIDNKLLNSKDYFFNYRSEESFNKMNKPEIQQVKNDYTNYQMKSLQTIPNNNINNKRDLISKSNNEYINTNSNTNINSDSNIINNDYKYTNFLNTNNLKLKNDYLINNNYKTFAPKTNEDKDNSIKLQIENEEKKLRKLEEEKNQLIKEEKETRHIFYNELTKRQSSLNDNYLNLNYEEFEKKQKVNNINTHNTDNISTFQQEKTKNNLKELLIQNKKEEIPIKPITNTQNLNLNYAQKYSSYNYNLNNNNNLKSSNNTLDNEKNDYYKNFLNQMQDKNEQISKNNLDTINSNFSNSIGTYNYEKRDKYDKIIRNERNTQKKKSLSVGNRQIEVKDCLNNYTLNYTQFDNKNYLNNNLYDNTKNEYNTNKTYRKTRYESEKKFNINSYFQIKDKDNNSNRNYNTSNYDNKSKYEQTLSSFSDETNKENENNINKINTTSNTTRNYPVTYTPNGLYRNNKTEINLLNINNNLRNSTIDSNLIYDKNYFNNTSKKNAKDDIIKTLNINNYNTMTQTRFYRNSVLPTQETADYSKEKLNTMSNLNTIKDYNNKNYGSYNVNTNNFKKQNSTRAFSNLNYKLDKENINNSNRYNNFLTQNMQNNEIINGTYNTLGNNNQNNSFFNKNNKILNNTIKSKCTLRKGKSYSNICKLVEPESEKENIYIDSYSKNYKYNKDEKNITDYNKGNAVSSYNNKTSYNNSNKAIYSFNKINNNCNRNICDKCLRRYFHNNPNFSGNKGNLNTGNNNNMRVCNNCKKLVEGGNGIKKNNYLLFA